MPIFGKLYAARARHRQGDERQDLPARADVKMIVKTIVTATVARKQVRHGMPKTASKGNRPAPTISRAENDHMAKFRRGISQVSQGL